MEASEVVGAHDPDEPDPGAAALQEGERGGGIGGWQPGLETGDHDSRMAGACARSCDPLGEWRKIPARFQRVARSDDPPYPVEAEAFQRKFGDQPMPLVRRIE